MKSAAERAAEAIECIPECPRGYKLITDEGTLTRAQIITAIISREYAELEKAAEQAMYALLSGDPEGSGYLIPADKVHNALDLLRAELKKVGRL